MSLQSIRPEKTAFPILPLCHRALRNPSDRPLQLRPDLHILQSNVLAVIVACRYTASMELTMDTPHPLQAVSPRTLDEISAAARATQANLVALRVAWCKRTSMAQDAHDIRTPPPGPVRRSRDLLIPRENIAAYADEEVHLRLRQVWGEFCALCWLFPFVDPQNPPDFDALKPNQTLRCIGEAGGKLAEIQTGLWRMRHEQRLRFDAAATSDPEFQRVHAIALSRPVSVFGQHISVCGNFELLACACEYAGMLAALRWATDDRWSWEAPGIMDVALPASS